MLIIGIVTLMISGGLAIYSYNKTKTEVFMSLERIISQEPQDSNHKADEKFAPIPTFDTCILKYNSNSKDIVIDQNSLDLQQDAFDLLVDYIVSNKQSQGFVDNYIFVCKHQMDSDSIILANKSILTSQQVQNVLVFSGVAIVFLVVIFFISIFVSNLVVKPVAYATEQQKRFVADASHELKTPLAVIKANNRILEKTANSKQKEWLSCNNDEIQHMSEIISDMLMLVKTESESQVNKTTVNISKLCKTTFLEFEPIAYENKIKFSSNIQPNLCVLYDQKMLKQLIMILVDNAIKYEASGGKVVIDLYEKNNFIILTVTNKNTIIPKEKLPHLFERFYKVDESRSSGGVGLGLAIAKNIVELNGGNISVKSEQNLGTVFQVDFVKSK